MTNEQKLPDGLPVDSSTPSEHRNRLLGNTESECTSECERETLNTTARFAEQENKNFHSSHDIDELKDLCWFSGRELRNFSKPTNTTC